MTEEHLARGRLALLNDASVRIGSTLDLARTAQELADVAIPRLADFVTVDLLPAIEGGDDPRAGSPLAPSCCAASPTSPSWRAAPRPLSGAERWPPTRTSRLRPGV